MTGKLMISCLVALATACGPASDEAGEPSEAPSGAADTQEEGAMGGMPGMESGMMERMRSHMAEMSGLSGDSVQAMLAMHRQMVANMLAQMNREMRDMEMATDSTWDATVDSLRSDLTRMPGMSAAELEALVEGHRQRVMRLMSMHEEMMGGMRR